MLAAYLDVWKDYLLVVLMDNLSVLEMVENWVEKAVVLLVEMMVDEMALA